MLSFKNISDNELYCESENDNSDNESELFRSSEKKLCCEVIEKCDVSYH